jgi:hypothetical protein
MNIEKNAPKMPRVLDKIGKLYLRSGKIPAIRLPG